MMRGRDNKPPSLSVIAFIMACYLWQLFLCPQCLQYACCKTSPLMMGENMEQLQPTEPVITDIKRFISFSIC